MIEKNNDNNALLGFTLMGAIMLFWLYLQPPVEESLVDTSSVDSSEYVDVIKKDSDKPVDLKNSLSTNISPENNFNINVESEDAKITF